MYFFLMNLGGSIMSASGACLLHDTIRWRHRLTYAVIPAYSLVSSPGMGARAYLRYGFEHSASTLPTRFPAALGIGHGSACGLANACALVYVAA